MVKVVGVRFKNAGKIYYFDPEDMEFSDGDKVVVETVRGLEFGEVVGGADMVPEDKITPPLRKVVRKATSEDEARVKANREKERKAFEIALTKIEAHGLPMKLVDVEYTFDNTKIIFFFTSDGRVDFRELVKDLAGVFKTRIELRQIGVRDEAKMIGGLGTCGRPLCCVTFLEDFEPVSIRMAKDQNLSLNPSKISGMCGRLMCCLRYEHDAYQELRKGLPPVGSELETSAGTGKIVDLNVLSGIATVRMDDGAIVNVNVRKQEDGAKACPVKYSESLRSATPGQENRVGHGNSGNAIKETGHKADEDNLAREEESSKKRSQKPRRRRRNRRRRRPNQAQSGEAKQGASDAKPAGKQVRSKRKRTSAETKTDDRGRTATGKSTSGSKDSKTGQGTKPKRRRRRRSQRSSSGPRQKAGNVSTPKEKPQGTGSR